MQSVRVHPRLRACLSFSFTIMGGLLVLLLIADVVKGRLSWDEVQRAVTITCIIAGGIGLFLYAIGWASATTINESGLYEATLLVAHNDRLERYCFCTTRNRQRNSLFTRPITFLE